jgi:hypothetical protein
MPWVKPPQNVPDSGGVTHGILQRWRAYDCTHCIYNQQIGVRIGYYGLERSKEPGGTWGDNTYVGAFFGNLPQVTQSGIKATTW